MKPTPSKRSWDNPQSKEKSKMRRLDMSKLTPPKGKRPMNMWALLPSAKVTVATTTNTTPTTVSPKMNTTTNPTITSSCRTYKRWGLSCPFCAKYTPHPSPKESDWSDEAWDGDRHRVREQKK